MYFWQLLPGDLFVYYDRSKPELRVTGLQMIVSVKLTELGVDLTWWTLYRDEWRSDDTVFDSSSHWRGEYTTSTGDIVRDGEVIG